MKFRVFWTPFAEEQLERMLEVAEDPLALTFAARGIDKILIASASSFGESRYAAMRVGFLKPLGVQFEVMVDVQTAIVHHVWRTDRK